MALTLVTGPANAEKAGHVLTAYRAALAREPLLVVPTLADVEHYRRELASAGTVFGVRVHTFTRLSSEMARRAGVPGRAIGTLTRERVAAAAVARAPLRRLGESARTAGFLPALIALIDELESLRVSPGRWGAALKAWAAQAPGREDEAHDLTVLYGAYRDALQRVGRDLPLHVLAALDALRLEPARWRATPLFLYGFDDLTVLQRDAIETLAGPCGADVTVALTYEAGRAAFAGRGETFQELLGLGAQHVALPARAEHYASGALHHIERSLFTGSAEETAPPRTSPGRAVRLLEGGGERAELELVAAHVARLIRDEGYVPEEIAVVSPELRATSSAAPPRERAALLASVFAAAGVPIALERRVRAGHTALGRGVVALLRCALGEGSADDLIAWLRTPGKLEQPGLADRLEGDVRGAGVRDGAGARTLWEQRHPTFVLHEIDAVAAAARRDLGALCERLSAEAGTLAAAPWRGRAAILDADEALEVRVAGALGAALRELATLSRRQPGLAPTPAQVAPILSELEVWIGAHAHAGTVAVTHPLAIRARRVRALFLCGLREGSFPRPGRPEPFLGDDERRAINAASGLRLRLREDRLAAERYLFYAALSRPTDLLALSWPAASDDGDPAVRSLFIDDVLDLLDPAPAIERRALGAAGFAEADGLAPTPRERLRAGRAQLGRERREPPNTIAPLGDATVLAELDARRSWSASGLEAWAACPVRWFVERLLRPDAIAPDPEPMLRGQLAHRVLEDALRDLVDSGGRLAPERVDEALEHLHAALARHATDARISVNPERLRSSLHRLEADLVRYVEHAAHAGSALAPEHFELRFGGRDDVLDAAPLAGGELMLEGRIDRIDVEAAAGGGAVVYDYKGKTAPPQATWLGQAKLQVGLYMLALPHLIGREAVGGLYQPLGGDVGRPRGLLRDDADAGLAGITGTDRVDADAFAAVLDGVQDAALAAVREIRAGALAPRPATCAYKGGCAYPSICRCEA